MMDQTAINAGFDFRRYAMKPRPANPRIIIAHVEGSGTAPMFPLPMSLIRKLPVFDINMNQSRDGMTDAWPKYASEPACRGLGPSARK
jgi:hypothetical protein